MVATCLLLAIGCSPKPATLTNKNDDTQMEQAMELARSSFDDFLLRFRRPRPGDSSFHIKVRIEDENGVEYFWVGDLKLDAEQFSGKIANEPGIVKKVKMGQTYTFTRSEVSDWMYLSNGTMQGNYTLRVGLESMPPAEAAAMRKQVGW